MSSSDMDPDFERLNRIYDLIAKKIVLAITADAVREKKKKKEDRKRHRKRSLIRNVCNTLPPIPESSGNIEDNRMVTADTRVKPTISQDVSSTTTDLSPIDTSRVRSLKEVLSDTLPERGLTMDDFNGNFKSSLPGLSPTVQGSLVGVEEKFGCLEASLLERLSKTQKDIIKILTAEHNPNCGSNPADQIVARNNAMTLLSSIFAKKNGIIRNLTKKNIELANVIVEKTNRISDIKKNEERVDEKNENTGEVATASNESYSSYTYRHPWCRDCKQAMSIKNRFVHCETCNCIVHPEFNDLPRCCSSSIKTSKRMFVCMACSRTSEETPVQYLSHISTNRKGIISMIKEMELKNKYKENLTKNQQILQLTTMHLSSKVENIDFTTVFSYLSAYDYATECHISHLEEHLNNLQAYLGELNACQKNIVDYLMLTRTKSQTKENARELLETIIDHKNDILSDLRKKNVGLLNELNLKTEELVELERTSNITKRSSTIPNPNSDDEINVNRAKHIVSMIYNAVDDCQAEEENSGNNPRSLSWRSDITPTMPISEEFCYTASNASRNAKVKYMSATRSSLNRTNEYHSHKTRDNSSSSSVEVNGKKEIRCGEQNESENDDMSMNLSKTSNSINSEIAKFMEIVREAKARHLSKEKKDDATSYVLLDEIKVEHVQHVRSENDIPKRYQRKEKEKEKKEVIRKIKNRLVSEENRMEKEEISTSIEDAMMSLNHSIDYCYDSEPIIERIDNYLEILDEVKAEKVIHTERSDKDMLVKPTSSSSHKVPDLPPLICCDVINVNERGKRTRWSTLSEDDVCTTKDDNEDMIVMLNEVKIEPVTLFDLGDDEEVVMTTDETYDRYDDSDVISRASSCNSTIIIHIENEGGENSNDKKGINDTNDSGIETSDEIYDQSKVTSTLSIQLSENERSASTLLKRVDKTEDEISLRQENETLTFEERFGRVCTSKTSLVDTMAKCPICMMFIYGDDYLQCNECQAQIHFECTKLPEYCLNSENTKNIYLCDKCVNQNLRVTALVPSVHENELKDVTHKSVVDLEQRFGKLESTIDELSKCQKEIVRFLVHNYDDAKGGKYAQDELLISEDATMQLLNILDEAKDDHVADLAEKNNQLIEEMKTNYDLSDDDMKDVLKIHVADDSEDQILKSLEALINALRDQNAKLSDVNHGMMETLTNQWNDPPKSKGHNSTSH